MYCQNCGKELDEGEVCLCEILGEDEPQKKPKKTPSKKKIITGIIAGIISFTLTSLVIPAIFEKISENRSLIPN